MSIGSTPSTDSIAPGGAARGELSGPVEVSGTTQLSSPPARSVASTGSVLNWLTSPVITNSNVMMIPINTATTSTRTARYCRSLRTNVNMPPPSNHSPPARRRS